MSSSERGKLSIALDKSKTKPPPPTISPSPLLSKASTSSKASFAKQESPAVEYIDQHASTSEPKPKTKESRTQTEEAPDVVFEALDLNVYGLQQRRVKSGTLLRESAGELPAWLTKPRMDPQHALEHDIRRIEESNAAREMESDKDSTLEGEEESSKKVSLSAIKAVLGWKDGQRVGKPRRAVTEGAVYRDLATPIQFLPRPELLGLGSKIERGTDFVRDGDKPRHVIGIDEKTVIRRVAKGSRVMIKEGEHADLIGVVIYCDRESVEVSLEVSEERVLLPLESCQLMDSLKQNEVRSVQEESISEDLGDWLQDGLVVRFVSRSWREGRCYNKRGTVEDTHRDPQTAITTCTISIQSDRREILHDVPPSTITPCPPVVGRPVIVLRGGHAGSIARLVEQTPAKYWIVQLDDSMELVTIASYDLGEFSRR